MEVKICFSKKSEVLIVWTNWLSGPLNRLNAILSHPRPQQDPFCDTLSRPISHPRTVCRSSEPPCSAQPRDGGAIASETFFKTSMKQERDGGHDSQPRPRPRLNSQPQGATKPSKSTQLIAIALGIFKICSCTFFGSETNICFLRLHLPYFLKSLLMGLFLMGCFPGDFQEENCPCRHSGTRPIKVGKRPIKEGKRPINANGLFSGTPPWWKAAPLRSMICLGLFSRKFGAFKTLGTIYLMQLHFWNFSEVPSYSIVICRSSYRPPNSQIIKMTREWL